MPQAQPLAHNWRSFEYSIFTITFRFEWSDINNERNERTDATHFFGRSQNIRSIQPIRFGYLGIVDWIIIVVVVDGTLMSNWLYCISACVVCDSNSMQIPTRNRWELERRQCKRRNAEINRNHPIHSAHSADASNRPLTPQYSTHTCIGSTCRNVYETSWLFVQFFTTISRAHNIFYCFSFAFDRSSSCGSFRFFLIPFGSDLKCCENDVWLRTRSVSMSIPAPLFFVYVVQEHNKYKNYVAPI